MLMYNLIKDYYNLGLYNNDDLELFKKVAWITETEKQDIISSKKYN